MKFTEIANRVTGISVPIFGISWNPPKLQKKVAENVITFLEDRRILYNPFELESPEHCIQSINAIREFLTQQLFDVESNSELGVVLRAMRSACRKFLDTIAENDLYFTAEVGSVRNDVGFGGQMIFFSGIGELRGTFGFLIANLLIRYGIDCENELLKILPLEIDE
ncbi:DUF6650 family protein [Flavobacterium ginsenosidimutans]|uniref:DUF6650 family protein n=1 Tax=Flavobacterium ginsenosidimutans TaxID=687844 RepID=UPI003D983383